MYTLTFYRKKNDNKHMPRITSINVFNQGHISIIKKLLYLPLQAKIMIISLSVIMISLPFILFHTQTTQNHASEAQACDAASWTDLSFCLSQNSQKIEITKMITCDNRTVCSITLKNQSGVEIYGTPDKAVGFVRVANYTHPIFDLENSLDINIHDLLIDNVHYACSRLDSNCATSDFVVNGGNNITINNIEDAYAQRMGVIIGNVHNITVENSKFLHPGLIAIWMNTAPNNPQEFHINNNFFTDSGTEALLLEGVGTPSDPNTVMGNLFQHDHSHWTYYACGTTGKDPCSGSAINVQPTTNTIISGNIINNDSIDNNTTPDGAFLNLTSGGMEIWNSKGLTITNNEIYNNTGGAFGLFDPTDTTRIQNGQIVIKNNEIYNNSLGLTNNSTLLPLLQQNNYTTPGHLSLTQGVVYTDPLTCFAFNGNSTCNNQTTIKWYVNDPKDVSRVMVNANNMDTLFAQNQSGSQLASLTNGTSWIGNSSYLFKLYSGNALLSTSLTTAVSYNQPIGALNCFIPNSTFSSTELTTRKTAVIAAGYQNFSGSQGAKVCVSVSDSKEVLFAAGANKSNSFSQIANWITYPNTYKFNLYQSNNPDQTCGGTPIATCTIQTSRSN